MKNLNNNEIPTDERTVLWDAICREAQKVMSFTEWTVFAYVGWVETGGKSLSQAYHENDLGTMQIILDAMHLEVEHYAMTPEDERQPVFSTN